MAVVGTFDVLERSAATDRSFAWRDGLTVAVAAAVLIALIEVPAIGTALSGREAAVVLTVLTGGLAVAAAFVWRTLFQLSADSRMAFGAAAMFVYGLIAVPSIILVCPDEVTEAGNCSLRVASHVVAAGLCARAARGRPHKLGIPPIGLFGIAVLAVLLVAGLGMRHPMLAMALTTSPGALYTLAGAGVVSGFVIVFVGVRGRVSAIYLTGLGTILTSSAHLWRIADHTVMPNMTPNLAFLVLRLLGVAVVGVSLTRLMRVAFNGLQASDRDQRARISVADSALGAQTRRNSELGERLNQLATVAGHLDHPDPDARRATAAALHHEVESVGTLLQGRN